jgi:hypothetical protein
MRLSVWSRQQPEVTPVVPFKNKIQHYQLKQSFLITPYNWHNQKCFQCRLKLKNPFECKKIDKNALFYFINVAFLIPTTSPHYFRIRLGNQEYSSSQLPTKMEKLEDWTKQPKASCLLYLYSTVRDKKHQYFSIVSLSTDSVIVDHGVVNW